MRGSPCLRLRGRPVKFFYHLEVDASLNIQCLEAPCMHQPMVYKMKLYVEVLCKSRTCVEREEITGGPEDIWEFKGSSFF